MPCRPVSADMVMPLHCDSKSKRLRRGTVICPASMNAQAGLYASVPRFLDEEAVSAGPTARPIQDSIVNTSRSASGSCRRLIGSPAPLPQFLALRRRLRSWTRAVRHGGTKGSPNRPRPAPGRETAPSLHLLRGRADSSSHQFRVLERRTRARCPYIMVAVVGFHSKSNAAIIARARKRVLNCRSGYLMNPPGPCKGFVRPLLALDPAVLQSWKS